MHNYCRVLNPFLCCRGDGEAVAMVATDLMAAGAVATFTTIQPCIHPCQCVFVHLCVFSYEPQGALVCVSCECQYTLLCASVCLGVLTHECNLPVITVCCRCAGVVFVLVLESGRCAEVQ